MRLFGIVSAALTFLALPTQAVAGALTLDAVVVFHAFQQTSNRPCVIGDNSCNYVTPIPPGEDAVFPDSGGFADITSADFLVSTIEAAIGSSTFWVGFDVNETNVDQTIEFFGMYINGILVDSFGAIDGEDVAVPKTIGGGNGTGYADYLFKGFTSLALFEDDDIVSFRAIMPLTNDGREQFFLIGTTVPCPDCTPTPLDPIVPEPATLVLFGTGLAAVAVAIRRRRRNA